MLSLLENQVYVKFSAVGFTVETKIHQTLDTIDTVRITLETNNYRYFDTADAAMEHTTNELGITLLPLDENVFKTVCDAERKQTECAFFENTLSNYTTDTEEESSDEETASYYTENKESSDKETASYYTENKESSDEETMSSDKKTKNSLFDSRLDKWCPLSDQWPSFMESMSQSWWGNVLPDAIDKILAEAPVGSVVVYNPRPEDPVGTVCTGHVRTKDEREKFIVRQKQCGDSDKFVLSKKFITPF